MMRSPVWAFGLMLLLFSASAPLHAAKPSDAHALEGVSSGKVVWDITVNNPDKLLVLLGVIEETYEDLLRQDVEPDMVYLFHGPVLKVISTEREGVPLDHEETYDQIAAHLQAMQQRPGVRMEACSIAARLLGMDTDTLIPGVELVGNTFVSLIGYQAKGYGLIPIY